MMAESSHNESLGVIEVPGHRLVAEPVDLGKLDALDAGGAEALGCGPDFPYKLIPELARPGRGVSDVARECAPEYVALTNRSNPHQVPFAETHATPVQKMMVVASRPVARIARLLF